ncbi:type II toxin-antitoxin system RelE/ParE family toxin [Fulvivirga ulvae]|uniref:type II toxin-antitoxin system RelE/ParE family toxin n=1 Tax=Fulvivirga ulvae TaxID=2904245 RepID=UPI001F3DF5F6|nr:type II toxin-antitoxin system RelE/ParE family toxin [Fulvivirga ulvae]UII31981.1 type II toxin-antitoxin system RelE/ParE family toxin [Fulvivirga ulvae]
MEYHFEIKEEASDEISDAFTWYESKKEGLGAEFVSLLEGYFKRIIENPLLYPIGSGEERVAVLKRFPYKIVYGIEKETIIVYAVFHTSRNPEDLER